MNKNLKELVNDCIKGGKDKMPPGTEHHSQIKVYKGEMDCKSNNGWLQPAFK